MQIGTYEYLATGLNRMAAAGWELVTAMVDTPYFITVWVREKIDAE